MNKARQLVYVLESTNHDTGEMEVKGVFYDLETVLNSVAGENRVITESGFGTEWRKSSEPFLYTTTFKAVDGYCDMRITEHKIYSYP